MHSKVWHPYTIWEDYLNGMYESVYGEKREKLLQKAIEFTGNATLYGSFMRRIILEWPYACEHNLTDHSINRKAWIGHAATCLAIQCPEDITRSAWGHLTQQQQDDANQQAQDAIHEWESNYARKNPEVCQQMGITGIL